MTSAISESSHNSASRKPIFRWANRAPALMVLAGELFSAANSALFSEVLSRSGKVLRISTSTLVAVRNRLGGFFGDRLRPSHQPTTEGYQMKKLVSSIALGASLCLAAVASTGCVHILNQPQGKVLSVTERGIGFEVSERPDNQTPQVKFGFFSSAVVILPTATNGTIASPNFANTFDFAQTGALQLGIGENISSGNYQTLAPNATNSAPTTQPVVPK